MTANIYAQSQQPKMAKSLEDRWQQLGLSPTQGVQ